MMAVVVRIVCRHIVLPDGSCAVQTMVVGAITGRELLKELRAKTNGLPEGTLSYAAVEGAPETQLGLDEKVLDAIKGEAQKFTLRRKSRLGGTD